MKKMSRLAALLMALLLIGVMAAASALAAATDTDIPATGTDIEQPTETPDEPTPTPTKKPSSSNSGSNWSSATSTPEPVEETIGAVVEVLDEADESIGYTGSTLTYLNGDNSVVILTSGYTPEVLASFKAWLATLANADATTPTDMDASNFANFVKNAKTLLSTVLPGLTEEQIDELLMAILTSGAPETELTADELAAFFGEIEISEVLGLYAQEGYAFCLALTDESIVLSAKAE